MSEVHCILVAKEVATAQEIAVALKDAGIKILGGIVASSLITSYFFVTFGTRQDVENAKLLGFRVSEETFLSYEDTLP